MSGSARSPYKRFKDLAATPSRPERFAVEFLLWQVLAQEGMTAKEIQIVEMAPPDMPAALYAKAVDGYCTGEPFGAAAQRAGYARPLRMTRDEWRNYICCVLTVREELIRENRAIVQDLVDHVLGPGVWLDRARTATSGDHRRRRKFFNQDPNIIRLYGERLTA